MGERRGICRVLLDNPKEKENLEDPGVDRIILRWTIREWDVGHGLDRAVSGEGRVYANAVLNLRVPCNAGNFLTS